MDINTYYNPLILFFEDLKKKYINDKTINVLYNSNNFDDADEIKFQSLNPHLYTFSITFWKGDNDFPRVSLYIKHPNNEEYFEIIDEYKGGEDLDINSLLSYIKTILSNKFVFEYEFMKEKLIKTIYTYYTPSNGEVKKNTVEYKKTLLIFPWLQKRIIKKSYEFKPWI